MSGIDFGQLAIDTIRAQCAATQSGIAIGRAQFAREVLSIVGTASLQKPLPEVVAELLAKCGEEQRR